MTPQAQQALATLIQKVNEGIDSTVAFSKAQVPAVIHELLVWKLVPDITEVLLMAGFFTFFTALFCWAWKQKEKEKYGDKARFWWCSNGDPSFAMVPIIGTVVSGIIFLIAVWTPLFEALQIWLAPKVFLIQYAASLVQGGGH